jgi:hypothetical protein
MSEYTFDEGSVVLPSGWFDRTLNVLGPEPNDAEFKVLISRGDQNGRTLDDFVKGQVKDLSQRMPRFAMQSQAERTIAGVRALEVQSTFRDGKLEMFQHQITFAVRGKFLTITAASLLAAREACSRELERLLTTVRLRPLATEAR